MDVKIRNNKYSDFQGHLENEGPTPSEVQSDVDKDYLDTCSMLTCTIRCYVRVTYTGAILITNYCFNIMMMEYDKMKDNR